MYTSLHNHTHSSILDGYQTEQELVSTVKSLGHHAVAITNHGTMRNIIPFYKECLKQGIKPIIGCEFYFCPNVLIRDKAFTHHLVLLAENEEGYMNLKKLDSLAYNEDHFFFKPRIDWKDLQKHSEGIICLSACMASIINTENGEEWFSKYKKLFGDRFYAEIQPLNIDEQQEYNDKVISLARRYNVPLVCTTDAHFAKKEDQPYHSLWVGSHGVSYHDNENYLWSEDELLSTPWLPDEVKEECIGSTQEITERCNVTIEITGNHYPTYPTNNPEEKIREICRDNWKRLVPKGKYKEYAKRFEDEIKDLKDTKYLNYLLVVWSMLDWCKQNYIPFGFGRGSVGGSLVGYLMGLHRIDAIKFGTKFYRFCNKERVSPPDIDTDVSTINRGRIIERIKEMYGNVCKVQTIGYTKNPNKDDIGKASVQMAWQALANKYKDKPQWRAENKISFVKSLTSQEDILTVDSELTKEEREELYDVVQHFNGRVNKVGCLPPNAMIKTQVGMKHIKDVVINDIIMNSNGEWNKVYDVIPNYQGEDIIKFTTVSNKTGEEFTSNHKMVVIDRVFPFKKDKRNNRMYTDLNVNYHSHIVLAKDVDIDKHLFFTPIIENNINDLQIIHHNISSYNCHLKMYNDIVVDKEMAWLLGMYIAEGWVNSGNCAIGFSLNSKEVDYRSRIIFSIYHKLGISPSIKRQKNNSYSFDIIYSSKMLRQFFSQIAGHGSENVFVPECICKSSDDIKLAFIQGIYDGEGQKTKRKTSSYRFSIEMKNQQVITWMYNTLLSLGCRCSYRKQHRKNGHYSWILGLSNNTFFRIYNINIKSKETYLYQMPIINIDGKKCIAFKINSKEVYKNPYEVTYDLSVEGNHTFVCNGFVVHNCHASAILVTPDDVENYSPVEGMNATNIITGKKEYIRCATYDFHDLEDMGCLKLDILGLGTLDVIDDTLKQVGDISIENIPMDDKKVYSAYANGEVLGCFQMDSNGMRNTAKELHTSNFNDVAALVALFRPGPIDSGMLQQYIDGKNGKAITYPCKEMEEITSSTYGVLVYQEQVMEIAMSMAGYTLGQADVLRKVIGRKEVHKIKEAVEDFISSCVARGFSIEVATEVAKQIEAAGRYLFNLAHSTEYGLMSYVTAYLKVHYPLQFMCSLLNSKSAHEDLLPYIEEVKRMGIKILPPNYNVGNLNWVVEGDCIRVGLTYIKGVARNINIINTTSFEDIVYSNNKKVVTGLIKSGALDYIGKERGWMISHLEGIQKRLERKKQCEDKIEENKTNLIHAQEENNETLIKKFTRQLHSWEDKLNEIHEEEVAVDKYDDVSGEMEVLSFSFKELPKLRTGKCTEVKEFKDKRGGLMARVSFSMLPTNFNDAGLVFASNWKKKITIEVGKVYEYINEKGIIKDAREVNINGEGTR